jgi:hypothetical protein
LSKARRLMNVSTALTHENAACRRLSSMLVNELSSMLVNELSSMLVNEMNASRKNIGPYP